MAKLPKGSPEFQAKLAEMKALSSKVKELEKAVADAIRSLPDLLQHGGTYPTAAQITRRDPP